MSGARQNVPPRLKTIDSGKSLSDIMAIVWLPKQLLVKDHCKSMTPAGPPCCELSISGIAILQGHTVSVSTTKYTLDGTR